MKRKHMLTLIGLLCALALALSAAFAEEDALLLPGDLGVVEVQGDELTIDDPALIGDLADADALSVPAALDLGELRFDDVPEAPAAQEVVAANDGEDYWDKDQFEAWYEGQKTGAASADHMLGPGGDLLSNYFSVIFPGETIAVVPDAEISDSGMAKYGQLGFGFTLYQLEEPVVETTYNGKDLLPRTGTPAKTALTVVETAELHIPYRARQGFTNIGEHSISKVSYVRLYRNDTGHPILFYNRGEPFNKSESAGEMLGYGGNNSGNPSFVGGGTIKSQPTLYIIENYYEVKYDYGDAAKDDLSFPATAPAAYADRIYIDKEDHTYQMPRPILKGCLFNGWDNRDDWQWGWLASHGYTSTQEDTRLGSVSRLTEDAYTHTMNFVTMLHKIEESTFSALRDVTLSAKFIEAGVGGSPSCLTVGFDPRGGAINGQKHLICETCTVDGYDFALDIGKFKPVRDGYTFKGWCTDPKDEAGTLIKDTKPENASAWAQDAHTELYAVWQSNTPTTISLAGAKVAAIKARTYTGKAIKPAVTVTLSGKTLKKGIDYTVTYKNNTNAGTATVTIKGKGDYTGTVTASFKINPASLAKAKVAAIQARTYTGKAIKPAVTVTLSGKTLKKGADYTVVYKNNKAIGKASVTIKGKGNYTASVSKTFAINPKAVSLASLTAGKGQLTVKWKKGTDGAGYQLEYSLKKSFTSSTKVKIAKAATVSRVLKNLKSGKTYYVRIRGYKLVGGKAYVSAWSKAMSKKVN